MFIIRSPRQVPAPFKQRRPGGETHRPRSHQAAQQLLFRLLHAQRPLDRHAIPVRVRLHGLSQPHHTHWQAIQSTPPKSANTWSCLSYPFHPGTRPAIH